MSSISPEALLVVVVLFRLATVLFESLWQVASAKARKSFEQRLGRAHQQEKLCLKRRAQIQCGRLERVINFSTLSAMIYGRPLPLRDLVNFLDGTKSLSK
jgi:hypothetical protein